jgi:hypothetical protein
VHNTVINPGRAVELASWDDRARLLFANNVAYSQTAQAVHFTTGFTGATRRMPLDPGSFDGTPE